MFYIVLAMILIYRAYWRCHQFIKLSDKAFLHEHNFTAHVHMSVLDIVVVDKSPSITLAGMPLVWQVSFSARFDAHGLNGEQHYDSGDEMSS